MLASVKAGDLPLINLYSEGAPGVPSGASSSGVGAQKNIAEATGIFGRAMAPLLVFRDDASRACGFAATPSSSDDCTPALQLVCDLKLPAEMNKLVYVRDTVARIAQSSGFGPTDVEEVRLAVGEAYVNAVKHGMRAVDRPAPAPSIASDGAGFARASREDSVSTASPRQVQVRVLTSSDEIVVEIRDCGAGFVPESIAMPPEDDLSPGGRGIYFMRLTMDEVSYDFSDGTLVRLRKRFTAPDDVVAD